MFEIQPMSGETYRQQTRRIAMLVLGIFVVLGMLFASLSVQLFGAPGGDNFRWNLTGVIAGLLATVLVVRTQLWPKPWMAPARYGWALKRHLMSITNVMHHVKAGVAANDPTAMKVLRFYHLGVTQMHQLDGNLGEMSQMVHDIDRHKERMAEQGLDTEQTRFDPQWIEAMKKIPATR